MTYLYTKIPEIQLISLRLPLKMRLNKNTLTTLLILLFTQIAQSSNAQLGFSFNLPKPKEYEDQQLRSEKSEDKKFTLPRHFIQNTTTHYNYYFNANNKLNEILGRAKQAHKDDYSQLLPFYNFTLDATAQDSIQLDSLTYKSSTAVALHDLRNDWVDNMYLIWGASYYLQKKFDSAYLMFQFINYAFSPKEKDGTLKTIGSSRDGNAAYSIATKEKRNILKKIFSLPPSRNDAFIWQIRNSLAQGELADAASLIVTLKNDPNFPKRLHDDLNEVQAYWFYKQEMWDSAAVHLVKALSNATNLQEKARWEYLAAQLFELSKNYKESEKYFSKVSKHTTDPIMDIYARLNMVKVNKDGTEKTIDKNISELMKMARQDRYQEYRDIIYFMAGQMRLEANDIDGAVPLLLKSTQYTSNDPSQRNKAFLKLAEVSYTKKLYRKASSFYDSLNFSDPSLKNPDELKSRKNILNDLALNLEVIERQDSLLRIASLPENERKDFVKKLVKELRKKQGLKGDDASSPTSPFANTPPPSSLFGSGNTKGEWYFYNKDSKARGLADFKSKWGNRPNVDNWRRSAAMGAATANNNNNNNNPTTQQGDANKQGATGDAAEISYDGLYANLPLNEAQITKANDSISKATFAAGKIYVQELEDCESGTQTLEGLRTRFPNYGAMDEVLFNLYYCYNKNGVTAKAAAIKKLMSDSYSNSNFTTIINTGKDPKGTGNNSEATKTYEKIYDLFLAGNFTQAIADKKAADSLYGKNYWTPQLLYIEAVYYIKQRQDSTAKIVLGNIVSGFQNTPMAAKATNLLNVLEKRAQIEDELSKLVVKRNEDTEPVSNPNVYWVPNNPASNQDSIKKLNPTNIPGQVNKPQDSLNQKAAPIASNYKFNAAEPHAVLLILNKVDLMYANESKGAFDRFNKETYYNKTMSASLSELNTDNRMLLIKPFKDAAEALDYVQRTKPRTSSEIVPWLKPDKYTYLIISDSNLEILKSSKEVETYKTFLNQHFPGKF